MEEEFQESDVIFRERIGTNDNYPAHLNSRMGRNNKKPKRKKKNSVPVDIPQNIHRNSWIQCVESDFFDDDEELVPPHVIVGRRIAGKAAFSVCTGNGRTLKVR
ncbi:hypothetical protein F0562_018206 [Nyssa sinensis]|uniref:Uncharacterized protein n=1 Tax=Nyssa sinensis TaxID=561372 RepID=A0A5J4ZCB8_9ASTE|nr:hypothetical protein F0562_018206 [Nyssa sinensis]